MDKLSYMQLDRMEEKIDATHEGVKAIYNLNINELLMGFYTDEIVDPKGELHHLHDDAKVNKFFEDIDSEENLEDSEQSPLSENDSSQETPKPPQDEYSQR